MDRRTRILVLVEHFGQGGAEKVAAMLAQGLLESGRYEVWLCAVYEPDGTPALSTAVPHRSLGLTSSRRPVSRLVNYFRKIARLRALKRALGIDLTISSLWPADWINAVTGADRKIAIIQINILNNPQNALMLRYRGLVRWMYGRFDKVVLGSAALVEELTGFVGLDASRLTVIPNPIDTALIDRNIEGAFPDRIRNLFEKYRIVVAANRLHATKNTDALAPILRGLEDRTGVKLLIVGEGEEEERLAAAIEKEGLRLSRVADAQFDESADVYLLGFQKNIHNLIHRAKVFLLPTRAEGSPLALLEAMYCATPVLASDCPNGGVFAIMQGAGSYDWSGERREPERTRAGYLMPIPDRSRPESIDWWSRKISELLSLDPASPSAMGSRGRLMAAAYDKKLILAKWLAIIDGVMGES